MTDRRFDLTASALGADSSDVRALANALAAKLQAALPDKTRVRQTRGGLLSRTKRLERLEVQFGDDTFVLSLHNREPATEKIKTVRGITIKRDQLPMHQWLGALSDALSAEANRSEEARLALERILS